MTPDSYDIKSKIGVIFQDVAVFDELNVYDNIDYFCGLYISDKNKRREYVEEAIKLVGLGEVKKYLPKQLSGVELLINQVWYFLMNRLLW